MRPPLWHPPVQRALATLLQASTRVSDDEVIKRRSWIVAGNWSWTVSTAETPPFSKGTLA
jgi:hypothetical protein